MELHNKAKDICTNKVLKEIQALPLGEANLAISMLNEIESTLSDSKRRSVKLSSIAAVEGCHEQLMLRGIERECYRDLADRGLPASPLTDLRYHIETVDDLHRVDICCIRKAHHLRELIERHKICDILTSHLDFLEGRTFAYKIDSNISGKHYCILKQGPDDEWYAILKKLNGEDPDQRVEDVVLRWLNDSELVASVNPKLSSPPDDNISF